MSITPERDDATVERAAKKVAAGLGTGRPRSSVTQDLVAEGWNEAEAQEFVMAVETALQETPAEGGGGGGGGGASGWLAWIAVLVIFNVLSYAFGWGWFLW